MLIDFNNFCHFMNIKSLSFSQVHQACELSRYYFQIHYGQNKANGAANPLSCFFLRDNKEKAQFPAEKTRILDCFQSLLINASFSALNATPSVSILYQVFVYGTLIFLQLSKFWNTFLAKPANTVLYKVNISSMRLRLQKLQETDSKAQKIRIKDGYKKIDVVIYHKSLFFMFEIIRIQVIGRYHDNFLAGYFTIKRTHELVVQKEYWPTLWHHVEAYVNGCDI